MVLFLLKTDEFLSSEKTSLLLEILKIKKEERNAHYKLHCNNVFKNISWNTQEDTGQTRDVHDIANNKPTSLFAGEAREQHSKGLRIWHSKNSHKF